MASSQHRRSLLLALLLVVLTCAAFLPVFSAGFIWDDDQFITHNWFLRSAAGLGRIWFDHRATLQYYPVTQTVFWLEFQLWGLFAPGYHVVNLLLHALSAVLLWQTARRLGLRAAWLAAALFAIHPVQVETVAWASELKNVLSGVFYLASAFMFIPLLFPSARDGEPLNSRPFAWRPYILAVLCYILALLAKTVTASLPAALLLITWWKSRAINRRQLMMLLPMFAIGLIAGLHSAYLERAVVGASGPEFDLTAADRVLIAGHACCFYLAKLAFPYPLAFFYRHWSIDPSDPLQWVYPSLVVLVMAALFLGRRRFGSGPFTAFAFFILTLFPALGFLNFYPMRYSFVADHFQYLACIGPLILASELFLRASDRVPAFRTGITIAAGAWLIMLATLTFSRTLIFRTARELYQDIIDKTPTSWAGHALLAAELKRTGELDTAAGEYKKAIEFRPDLPDNYEGLADTYLAMGRPQDAQRLLEPIVQRQPTAKAFNDLAGVYLVEKRPRDALLFYRRATESNPALPEPWYNLATLQANGGDFASAADSFSHALAIRPEWPEASLGLARTLASLGRIAEAIPHFQRALALRPGWPEAEADLRRAQQFVNQNTLPVPSGVVPR